MKKMTVKQITNIFAVYGCELRKVWRVRIGVAYQQVGHWQYQVRCDGSVLTEISVYMLDRMRIDNRRHTSADALTTEAYVAEEVERLIKVAHEIQAVQKSMGIGQVTE